MKSVIVLNNSGTFSVSSIARDHPWLNMSRTVLLCFKPPEIGSMVSIEEQELWEDIHLMMDAGILWGWQYTPGQISQG